MRRPSLVGWAAQPSLRSVAHDQQVAVVSSMAWSLLDELVLALLDDELGPVDDEEALELDFGFGAGVERSMPFLMRERTLS